MIAPDFLSTRPPVSGSVRLPSALVMRPVLGSTFLAGEEAEEVDPGEEDVDGEEDAAFLDVADELVRG